jgi:hypothetical protein
MKTPEELKAEFLEVMQKEILKQSDSYLQLLKDNNTLLNIVNELKEPLYKAAFYSYSAKVLDQKIETSKMIELSRHISEYHIKNNFYEN